LGVGVRLSGGPRELVSAPRRRASRSLKTAANGLHGGRVSDSGLYNYDAFAGDGSATFRGINENPSWRAALLGTVAAGAFWCMTPKPARAGPDACTTLGATATCQGNQSGGIHSGADFNPATVDTLNVNSLTTNIAPPANTSGIYFGRINPGDTITINSDTTPHSISVTGIADGIVAVAPGNVTINHTGDITSAGDNGITLSSGSGTATVTATGAITAYYDGISATGTNGVTVNHTGDLTSLNHFGILASSAGGAASITSVGNVNAYNDALYAHGPGNVTVNNTGNVTSHSEYGIAAVSSTSAASVVSSGNISAYFSGIFASGNTTATVTSTGNIISTTLYGIRAVSVLGTTVTSHGNISAYANGIQAIALGPGGDVTVSSTGDVTSTHGRGIFAASSYGKATVISTGTISAYGDGIGATGYGDVAVTHTGDISAGDSGIHAYSPYGKVDVTVTGTISAVGHGISAAGNRDVTVTHTGDITSQVGSGIYAFSQYGKATVTHTGNISARLDGIAAIGYGDVSVTHTGNITAQQGDGIYAYSHAGAVTIVSTGNIKVYGSCGCSAHGIFAYGYIGVSITHTGDITSSNGFGILALARYNNLSITTVGKITADADGIYAQAQNGDVTINHTGDITSANGSAINASAAGNINVTVNGGKISGGYAGIFMLGGYTNTVTVGSSATVTGGTFAIAGTIGDDTVDNFGTVTGDVDLGGGSNAFNNMPGGLFNSGAIVDLGGGTLTNDGTLAPGGVGTVQTTALTGNFVQNSGGKFAVDVNMAGGTADRLDVSGTANLGGAVAPHVVSLAAPPQTFTILSAAGGTTNNGLTVQNSAAVTYQLAYPNPNDVLLTVAGISFAPSGLTPNEQAIGQHLQGVFGAGGGGLNALLLYLANLDLATFADALDHLSPESYLAQTEAQLLASFSFADTLFSCPLPANGQSLMGEGRCLWLQPSGHVGDHGAQTGYIGFNEKAAGITGGAQNELAPNWYLDVGFGYERSHIDVDNALASASGDVYHGGAALKYIRDNWMVAGSVSGSLARYDTSRYGIPTAGTATARADTDTLDFRLRFAYAFGSEAFYVKPLVNFDAIGLWRGAINESGAGALDLNVRSQNDWLVSAAPALEIGTQWQQGGTIWRPYVRAGVRFLSDDSFSTTASFAGSPAGVAPFTVTTPIDQTQAEVSAGFDVWQNGRYNLRIAYDGRFGAHSSENGGELKLRAAF